MNLREVKIERKKKGSEPLISISQTGLLRMNKAAIEVISGKGWQRAGLFNDADSPNNWYIGVSNEGVKVSIHRDGSLRGAGCVSCLPTDKYMRSADDRKHCVYTLLPAGAVYLGQT